MMTRRDRAKQFLPYDSVKGLQEALREREERHARVERHGLGEEELEELSAALRRLKKGDRIRLFYWRAFHDAETAGTVTAIDFAHRFLCLNGEKVLFEDVYRIRDAQADPCP